MALTASRPGFGVEIDPLTTAGQTSVGSHETSTLHDPPEASDVAPAVSSSSALARFEFESGKGNEGTKILMVEWEDEEDGGAEWEVSWEGKTPVVSSDGGGGEMQEEVRQEVQQGQETAQQRGQQVAPAANPTPTQKHRRLYFLLGPGASVPRLVRLAQPATGRAIQTNPLPAIFPPELGRTARAAGKKGVLHTIWAKKRLSVLQRELAAEMQDNGEGIGLEMVMRERDWIEENFGVVVALGAGSAPEKNPAPRENPSSPTSPKTPGGRLAEKLKGLKLGTSSSDLSTHVSDHLPKIDDLHPLSPDTGDVAISSFALFHGTTTAQARPTIRTAPPSTHLAHQLADFPGIHQTVATAPSPSLDAILTGHPGARDDPDVEEGLFAVKMSPRSPEMSKSPFSFR